MRAREKMLPWSELSLALDALDDAIAHGDVARARGLLQSTVPEYAAIADVVDWVTCAEDASVTKEIAREPMHAVAR